MEATWFSDGDTEKDTVWSFVQECLLLLLTLARHLSAELELFQQTAAPSAAKQRTPEMAPPLPPDVLSVTQQKTIAAALQFVVSLGLCPYLAPGVGVSLGRRSAFGAMVEKLVHAGAVPAAGRRLLTTTSVLLQLAELSALATLVFTRHLGDVMAALCQLGYRPQRAERSGTEEEKVTHQVRKGFCKMLSIHVVERNKGIHFASCKSFRCRSSVLRNDELARRRSKAFWEKSTSQSSSRSC